MKVLFNKHYKPDLSMDSDLNIELKDVLGKRESRKTGDFINERENVQLKIEYMGKDTHHP